MSPTLIWERQGAGGGEGTCRPGTLRDNSPSRMHVARGANSTTSISCSLPPSSIPLLAVPLSRSLGKELFMAFQVLRPERALRPSSRGR